MNVIKGVLEENLQNSIRMKRQSRKGYKYKGLLNEPGGKKLSSGCVIIPNSQRQKIEKFFNKLNVIFEQLKVWK